MQNTREPDGQPEIGSREMKLEKEKYINFDYFHDIEIATFKLKCKTLIFPSEHEKLMNIKLFCIYAAASLSCKSAPVGAFREMAVN